MKQLINDTYIGFEPKICALCSNELKQEQSELILTLMKHKFTVIPRKLRHSRTLGGGFHCVTLDLLRETK